MDTIQKENTVNNHGNSYQFRVNLTLCIEDKLD